jgi:hypothetical protein
MSMPPFALPYMSLFATFDVIIFHPFALKYVKLGEKTSHYVYGTIYI